MFFILNLLVKCLDHIIAMFFLAMLAALGIEVLVSLSTQYKLKCLNINQVNSLKMPYTFMVPRGCTVITIIPDLSSGTIIRDVQILILDQILG